MGYDGKGQVRVRTREDVRAAFDAMGGVTCLLEKMLPLAYEVSVLTARGADGASVVYPIAENVHRDGILFTTTVPGPNVSPSARQAQDAARAIVAELGYVGVLCIEFFVLEDGSLVVNEMAPRPHNSGHYTIDACVTSQFAQQVRAMARLPLGDVRQHSPAVMLNILGDVWFDGDTCARAGLGPGAGAAGRQPAPVRQGRPAPRPQDGPRDLRRADAGSRRRQLRGRLRHPGHRGEPCTERPAGPTSTPAARALEAGQLVALPDRDRVRPRRRRREPGGGRRHLCRQGPPAGSSGDRAPGARRRPRPLGREIPAEARQLAEAFWPGPLTMILKRAPNIPDAVSGGQDTVGMRCPSHPVAIALLQAFKGGQGGVAAPSANKFGHVSPTTAQHVRDEFGADGALAAVLDGGQSEVGIESTIVDLSRLATHGPVLLRPGHVSRRRSPP
jgi:hypothetical protein